MQMYWLFIIILTLIVSSMHICLMSSPFVFTVMIHPHSELIFRPFGSCLRGVGMRALMSTWFYENHCDSEGGGSNLKMRSRRYFTNAMTLMYMKMNRCVHQCCHKLSYIIDGKVHLAHTHIFFRCVWGVYEVSDIASIREIERNTHHTHYTHYNIIIKVRTASLGYPLNPLLPRTPRCVWCVWFLTGYAKCDRKRCVWCVYRTVYGVYYSIIKAFIYIISRDEYVTDNLGGHHLRALSRSHVLTAQSICFII